MTEQISERRIKKRKLQNELANLRLKESKSVTYRQRKSQKCNTDGHPANSSKQIDVMLKRRAPDFPDNNELCIVTKKKIIVVEETESGQSLDNVDDRVEETTNGQQEPQPEKRFSKKIFLLKIPRITFLF